MCSRRYGPGDPSRLDALSGKSCGSENSVHIRVDSAMATYRTGHISLRAWRATLACVCLTWGSAGTAHAEPLSQNSYIPTDKTPWYQEAPNVPVRLAPLWGDRVKGEAGTLLRAPAGFRSGPHTHTADYWAIVVLGTWEHWVPSTSEGVGTKLEPGAFWTQIKDQPHEDACVSATPCTIFLFNKTPYVTEFAKQK
jgi:hypothetical protein